MSRIVARTCTEIEIGDDGQVRLGESRPLSAFRSRPALVLLGDPGAGKTTEFKEEGAALTVAGAEARYLTARNFAWDVDSDPDLRDKVLLIDGLDEMRAGSGDGRVPLDRIRRRLARLGRPRFRISCREADWLGNNDRDSLAAVSPNEQLTVVRLDPLTEESVMDLLGSRIPGSEVKGFIDKAQRRGVRPLLDNPLTLELLVDAVDQGEGWPQSRHETFEMACKKLASEQNPEHRIAAAPESPGTLMDAAGYLCALQLLTGIEGYSLPPGPHDSSFVELDELEELPAGISLATLKRALATGLFTAAGETAFVPIHRQVAEFFGGRYLASLVEGGLPAKRVTALMTSPGDGYVVTALRGLSAWLAAYPGEARHLLIDADPVGVGLYGDIGSFTKLDKEHLLGSLATFAMEGPLLGHGRRDGRNSGFRDDTASTFRSLVSADMIPAITNLIDPGGGETHDDRVVEFVLRVLSKAAKRELEHLACLMPRLEAILHDPERSTQVKQPALDAYLHITPSGDAKTLALRNLLKAFHDGSLPDPDDELRGTLLGHLYPGNLSPAEVWRYAAPRNNRRFGGRFWLFWIQTLLQKSSNRQVALLLDTLHDNEFEIVQILHDSGFRDLSVELLARGLRAMGDEVEISRLYNWLSATLPPIKWRHMHDDHTQVIRKWLEARPHIQKEIVLEWIARNDPSDPSTWLEDVLYSRRLPKDFVRWCLDQAIALNRTEPALSRQLLQRAYHSLSDPSINAGVTLELMYEQTSGLPALAKQLNELRQRSSSASLAADERRKRTNKRREQHLEDKKKRREDWEHHLRLHETGLRANRFSPENLDKLAAVYFGWAGRDTGASGHDRIAGLIGSDPRLVNLVMDALRDAIRRDDLPEIETTISLYSESRRPWLASPVLASMDLLIGDPQSMNGLDEEWKRRALAIYYCWGNVHPRSGRACRAVWFRENPNLVLDVLYRCALAGLRKGNETLPGVYDLDGLEDHRDLVHDTRLRLLEAFPTRVPEKQLRPFDHLLGKTLEQPNISRLKTLAGRKLTMRSLSVSQRVRWMTVDALLSQGRRTRQMRTYVGENERRIRNLAEFLHNTREDADGLYGILSRHRDPAIHATLVEVLGRSFGPCDLDGFMTLEISTSELIGNLISQLRSMPDIEARDGLARLVAEPRLERWRDHLTRTMEHQRVVYRDATYQHPDIEQVQKTLDNRAPANAADLAALLRDLLANISDHMRGDSANLWQHFWNEDSRRRPDTPKHEESCRDMLLEPLRLRLPSGVDAAPEGRYAAGRRADIRVSYGGFNVPIEIKKNSHRDLWSALRNQLIDRYTTDPDTSGYGIYLVLWFGPGRTTPHPDSGRPTSRQELSRRLEDELTADEARKIAVIVMDVTKPGVPSDEARTVSG